MNREKRDTVSPITVRLTPKENRLLRDVAKKLGWDVSDYIRKAAIYATPNFLFNKHTRRGELEDLIVPEKCLSDD